MKIVGLANIVRQSKLKQDLGIADFNVENRNNSSQITT